MRGDAPRKPLPPRMFRPPRPRPFRPRRVFAWSLACLAVAVRPACGGEQALVSGVYGASLGAGGATAAERSAFGQNPASLHPRRAGAYAHFHRPFGVDDLEVAEAGLFADASRWGLAVDWRRTGVEGLYAEQGIQAVQAFRFGGAGGFPGWLDLGLAWNGWRREWPGGRITREWSHGLGAVWRMLPRLRTGAFVSGLPLDREAGSGTDRILQWGLEADSRERESGTPAAGGSLEENAAALRILRLDFRRTGDLPWRTLASLSFSPHPSVEITGGFANPPFQASLGLRFAWAGVRWDQALRYHRYLGRTWLSGLAFSRAIGSLPGK